MSTKQSPTNLSELLTFIDAVITAKKFTMPKHYEVFQINKEKKCVELKFSSPLLLRQEAKDPAFKAPFMWTKCPKNENAKTMSFFLI